MKSTLYWVKLNLLNKIKKNNQKPNKLRKNTCHYIVHVITSEWANSYQDAIDAIVGCILKIFVTITFSNLEIVEINIIT
jgi:hypothetical protein